MFARSSEQRHVTIAALRDSMQALRSSSPVSPALERETTGSQAIPSGWSSLDQALPGGGLMQRSLAHIDAPPGHGGIALASSWARHAALLGHPTLVIDAGDSALPHPWVEPIEAKAPIWVALPSNSAEVWPAVDLAVRSKAFGLVIVTLAPAGPDSLRTRMRLLLKRSSSRLLCLCRPPYQADLGISVRASAVRWERSCLGDAPQARQFQVRCFLSRGMPGPWFEVNNDIALPRRLHLSSHTPDRSTPSRRSEPNS